MSNNDSPESIPYNHVLAVLGRIEAESAEPDLTQAGYSAVKMFTGEQAAEVLDAKGDNSGPIGKLVKTVHDHLSEQTNYLAQYEEEARDGNIVIAVEVENPEAADQVRVILERHNARNVRLFGRMAVSDLTPATNPSLRADDSPEEQAKQEEGARI